jgi:hypothetical protein
VAQGVGPEFKSSTAEEKHLHIVELGDCEGLEAKDMVEETREANLCLPRARLGLQGGEAGPPKGRVRTPCRPLLPTWTPGLLAGLRPCDLPQGGGLGTGGPLAFCPALGAESQAGRATPPSGWVSAFGVPVKHVPCTRGGLGVRHRGCTL